MRRRLFVPGIRASRLRGALATAVFAASLTAVATVVAPAGAAVPTGGFSVNINNREDVRQFFNQVHDEPQPANDGFTGNVSTCTPGTDSQAWLDATLTRINYFRTMSGEPDVTFSAANNAEAQAAALIQSANGSLNHFPPTTSTCWTQLGSDGSGASNLALGNEGPTAIDSLMYDGSALGHRRNMLNPSINLMGSGSIPSGNGVSASEAQLVLTTPLTTRPAVRTGFVAWPPAGFVPFQVVYPRWSFALPGANFTGATVTMQHNGSAVPVQIRCADPSTDPACPLFSEPAIVWSANGLADGASWPKPAADDPWTVTISNVSVNGTVQPPFSYTVTVIDPSVSDAAHTIATAPSGPANPGVNQNATYTVPAVQDASGYQWRTTSSTPGDFVDGAENGLGNFTANISPTYTPISTVEHATGASSFHLQGFGGAAAPPQQTLTVNESVLANANSSLGFDSMFWNILNETASVDVSTDGGTSWQSVFTASPPSTQQDSTFAHQTVSLSQFAGHQIQLRFALTFTGGNWQTCCGEPNGWYFDNVSLSNVLAAATPTLSAVGANPTFTLNTPTQGPLSIDVRPQFSNASFGSSFGPWSPALPVTVVGSTGLTTLTSSANPSGNGAQVTFTAAVSPTDGGGTVSFTANGTALGACQSLALTNNAATCAWTPSTGGSYAIVATYTGDGNFAGSTSNTLNQVVNAPAFTGGGVDLSSGQISTGQAVTVTATVSPNDGGGTVNFTQDLNTIPGCGAAPLNAAGVATCTWTPTLASHSDIGGYFSGDAAFISTNLGSAHLEVITTTATSLTSDTNPSTAGQLVGFTARVTPVISLGSVQFTDNGLTIPGCGLTPLDSTGTASCAETFAADGPHQIQAFYSGFSMAGTYKASASPILAQTVGALTASSTTIASSANPSATGQQVTFTATTTGGDGGGTVTFTDFGDPIAGCPTGALTAGQATCSQTFADTSPHSIAAAYSGDATTAGSTSTALSQTVNTATTAAPPTVAATNLGNGAAQIGFTAPTTGARPARAGASTSSATGFNVYEGTSAGGESGTPVNPSRILATATGFTVTGLTVGTKYYFKVRALNPGGLSPASKEVSTTPAKAPSAPRTLAATAGAESVGLTWTAPSSTGGAKITGYNVYLGTAAGAESKTPLNPTPLAATARAYTATGLTDGTAYFFAVRAVNAVASSPASNESSATPVSVPNPPVKVAAYPANAALGITWAAPENTGGTPITGYNVYKGLTKGGESGTPVNASPLPAGASNYRVTGLANGTKYFVVVKAINAVGTSAASTDVSATATAAASAPLWPGTLTAAPMAASVKLTWSAPAVTGGSAITGYNVYRGTTPNGESGTPVNSAPLAASATTYTATGLKNAKNYYFVVKAINAIGTGAPSNEAFTAPQATAFVPGAPASVGTASGTKQVTVSWTPPVWNGGSAITGYNVYRGTAPGAESGTPLNASPLAASARNFVATGLTSGKVYYFTVKAINAVGTGSPSEASGKAN
jgi:uncharacterized protein YkwD